MNVVLVTQRRVRRLMEKLTTKGDPALTLSVKRIKNMFYVYDQLKTEGKVVMKYIGSLNRVVDSYRVVNSSPRDNYRERDDIIDSLVKGWEGLFMVRGVGFEPTQAYANGS